MSPTDWQVYRLKERMEALEQKVEELAQRPWVSLTEKQKDSLLLPFGSYWVIDAIEALLKENNGV